MWPDDTGATKLHKYVDNITSKVKKVCRMKAYKINRKMDSSKSAVLFPHRGRRYNEFFNRRKYVMHFIVDRVLNGQQNVINSVMFNIAKKCCKIVK